MFHEINTLGVEATVHTLLYGSKDVNIRTNYKIFEAVHLYIESTGRL